MERLFNKLLTIFFFSVLGLYSCKSTRVICKKPFIGVICNSEKIKFKMSVLDDRGHNSKTNQPIDYEFCIPDNETVWAEVLIINPQLKKTNSKGRSNCGKGKVLVLGNTDNKDYKTMLCKIANLDYVKEVNQTFWE